MEKTKIQNPHDKLFRASMQYSEVARDFLRTHLPEHIKSKIDLKTLKSCPESFIDEDLRLFTSDVLIQCEISGIKGYVYVLAEHQSTQDHWMSFRLLKYMIKIWELHAIAKFPKKDDEFNVVIWEAVALDYDDPTASIDLALSVIDDFY